MRNITCLLLCFLAVGCITSEKRQQDELKVFLTEWSAALQKQDESVRRFYDPRFTLPDVFFKAPEGLTYNFGIDDFVIWSQEENNIRVDVPYQIKGETESTPEKGFIKLTVAKTEKGFWILDMDREFAVKLKEHAMRLAANEASAIPLKYDSVMMEIRTAAASLSKHYDSVVFFTQVTDQTLYYVVNGNWEYPYSYKEEEQRNSGNYKMGVVTADNKVIIPVAYTKIYNPYGSFPEMIEVENNGVRGLFHISGKPFLPVEFDGIYPTRVPGVFAQVKKGEQYGWVNSNGTVSFDPSSHAEKKLFQSPVESNAILGWKFIYPGPVKLLVNPYDDLESITGIIVFPSYVHDLKVSSIANAYIVHEYSEYGMGTTDLEIKFEKVESLSDKLFGLIAFFMEAGGDARGYHTVQNDIVTVDKSMQILDYQKRITINQFSQNPCGELSPEYRTIGPGLYESHDGQGEYKYFKIHEDGNVEQLTTDRQFNFTKFVQINEQYFSNCRYEDLGWQEGKPNVVIIRGISYEDLDIMRNEIFAEYGFIFKTPKWKKYFEAKPWYKPQFENVDHLLTPTDKENIKFILEYQRTHKDQQVERDSIHYGWAA